jgi:NAD(P)-dependent dehydrogenase (short-subunit alcohol dehydrogenase family)
MSAYDFRGRCVLVTGGSQGIGEAVARSFALAGAETTILAENEAVMATSERLTSETGCYVRGIQCDIADEEQVIAAIGQLTRLEVLVNNAGYQPLTPIDDASLETGRKFRDCIVVNVVGTWLVTRHALPLMRTGGRIIITSSIWGKTGASGYSAYTASKHANIGFMRSLALELGSRGITVNCVCPGWVETEGALWTVRDIARTEGRTVDDLIASYTQHQPRPGMMRPSDLAATYLFLASDGAADITGQAINVDRGHFIG